MVSRERNARRACPSVSASPLVISGLSILNQLLQRISQCFDSDDLDFGAITEMRKNIENNILARIRHDADDKTDLFFDNSLHHIRNVRGGRGMDRLKPTKIGQGSKPWRDALQYLANLFHCFPDILFGYVPGHADHEQ